MDKLSFTSRFFVIIFISASAGILVYFILTFLGLEVGYLTPILVMSLVMVLFLKKFEKDFRKSSDQ